MARTTTLVLLACASLGLWVAAVACGAEAEFEATSDGGDDATTKGDGAAGEDGSGGDGGNSSDAGRGDARDAQGIDGCGLTPVLQPQTGLRCPNVTDAGNSSICVSGDLCCQPPSDAGEARSACAPTCPPSDGGRFNGVIWQCQDPAHCAGSAGGAICCASGLLEFDNACGYLRSRPFVGTSCRGACAGNEFIVCEEQSQCPQGTTCKPLKARGGQLGACLPP